MHFDLKTADLKQNETANLKIFEYTFRKGKTDRDIFQWMGNKDMLIITVDWTKSGKRFWKV